MHISRSNKVPENKFENLTEQILNKPYVAVTKDIQVTVWPEFVDNKSSTVGNIFIWAYHIRIDNKSLETVKLISRHWRIIDENGIRQEVNGDGVIGEQPSITPNNFYQYSSGVHLYSPSGIMSGTYQMKKDSGEVFDIVIPTFSLDIPAVQSMVN